MPEFDPRSTTLEGEHVRLEPLGLNHVPDLFEAGRSGEIWAYLPIPGPKHAGEMETLVRDIAHIEFFLMPVAQGFTHVDSVFHRHLERLDAGALGAQHAPGLVLQVAPIIFDHQILRLMGADHAPGPVVLPVLAMLFPQPFFG